jgi:hypothetical protein
LRAGLALAHKKTHKEKKKAMGKAELEEEFCGI